MGSKTSREQVPLSQAMTTVHGGERPEEQPYGAVVSPVFHSATYSFQNFAEMRRYVSYPLYSSHAGFSASQLRTAGVSAATVRFAVGIEAAKDIIADITQALDKT